MNKFLYESGNFFISGRLKQFLDHYYIGDDNSIFYFSNWSIVHFLSGIIIGYILTQILDITCIKIIYIHGFIIHSIWELWQILVKNTKLNIRGIVDISVDTICFMIGLYIYIYIFNK